MTANRAVAEAADENPATDAGRRKSRDTSTAVAPAGTTMWNAYISTSSLRQGIDLPPAVSLSPARSVIGPVGPCSPGIHFGYISVSGPGGAGIESRACRILGG